MVDEIHSMIFLKFVSSATPDSFMSKSCQHMTPVNRSKINKSVFFPSLIIYLLTKLVGGGTLVGGSIGLPIYLPTKFALFLQYEFRLAL